MKRFIVLLVCLTLVFSVGCNALLEDEYVSITNHRPANSGSTVKKADKTVEIISDSEIESALLQFVTTRTEEGTMRFVDYQGNVENDVSRACMKVTNETPIGAYAVYYMNYTVNQYMSYYEAEITITYKRSLKQISNIQTVSSEIRLERNIANALFKMDETMAFYADTEFLSELDIQNCVKNAYYDNPGSSLVMPKTETAVYPDNGDNRIVEISFNYLNSTDIMEDKLKQVNSAADKLARSVTGDTEGEKYLNICRLLSDKISHVENEEYNVWNDINTISSAMLNEKASSEGFALAYKMLCDRSELECKIVSGRHEDKVYFWNIVKLDGNYYHVDPAGYSDGDLYYTFLRADEDMSGKYWWDTEKYPKCEGYLNYYSIVGYPSESEDSPDEPEDSPDEEVEDVPQEVEPEIDNNTEADTEDQPIPEEPVEAENIEPQE